MLAPRIDVRRVGPANLGWQRLVARLTEELYLRVEQRQSELLLLDATARYRQFLATMARLRTG